MPWPNDIQFRRFYPPDMPSGQAAAAVGFASPTDLDFNGRELLAGGGWWTPYIRCTGFNSFMLYYETLPIPIGLDGRVEHDHPESFTTAFQGAFVAMAIPFTFGGFSATNRHHSFIAFRVFIYNPDVVDVFATVRLWASTRQ